MTPPKSRTDSAFKDAFKDAEALGKINTMPELKHTPAVEEPNTEVITDPTQFQMAIARAQFDGIDHVIVDKNVLMSLLRGNKGVSLTYGNPGVRVYLEGTKESCEDIEKLSAEAYHEHYVAMMRGERVEKQRSGK